MTLFVLDTNCRKGLYPYSSSWDITSAAENLPQYNYPQTLATKRYLLLYPDGSKAFIKAGERDKMLISGTIAHLDTYRYKYIAHKRTFHTFTDYGLSIAQSTIRRHLGLRCIFELHGKRRAEHEHTEHDIVIRAQLQPNALSPNCTQ